MTEPSSCSRPSADQPGPADGCLRLSIDLAALRRLRPWLDAVVDVGEDERPDVLGCLELAVHELCVNIVEHACASPAGPTGGDGWGELVVELWNRVDRIEVRTLDHGLPFDQASRAHPEPGVAQEHGYGLMIIEQLVDELRYERTADRNIWHVVMTRSPAPAVPAPAVPASPLEPSHAPDPFPELQHGN